MKNLLFLVYLIIPITLISQVPDEISFTFHKNNSLNVQIDSISFDQFNNELYSSIVHDNKSNSETQFLIDSLVNLFPNSITITDSSFHFIGNEDKEINLYRRIYPDSKNNSNFEIISSKYGYLIVREFGYEWWRYYLLNLESKSFLIMPEYPQFIGNKFVYAAGNYYGEGFFKIVELNNYESFAFDSFNWLLKEYYFKGNEFHFKFTRNFKNYKYVKLEIE